MYRSGRKYLARFATLVLTLGAVVIAAFSIAAKEEGVWVESGSGGGCPGQEVCADWEVEGESTLSCCIDPKFLGTSDFEACSAVR